MSESKLRKYYKDLERLFKDGPVVRHKVANKIKAPGDHGVPVGTARAFLKSVNSAYASTMASYGQYNRLARYCIVGTSLIVTNDKKGYMTIKDLTERFENGEKIFTYAYDKENKEMVCVPVAKAWKTKVDEIWEIEFDDGLILRCTKDHPIMLRDGSYKEAQLLQSGDAVMPFHRKSFEYDTRPSATNYRWVYSNRRGWTPEHRLVAEVKYGIRFDREYALADKEVHHVNFERDDNSLDNLRLMDRKEHRSFHTKINNKRFEDPKEREKQSRIAKKRWAPGGDLRENIKEITKKRLSSEGWKRQVDRLKAFNKTYKPGKHNKGRQDQKLFDNANADKRFTFQDVCNAYEKNMKVCVLAEKLGCSIGKIRNRLKWEGYGSYTEFKQNYKNHKVVSVRATGKFEDVYDLTIDKYHNFAVGQIVDNSLKSLIVSNSDYNEMESMAEIGSALDIYSDEACSPGEDGMIVKIISPNTKIRSALEDLFYDTLNLEFEAWNWIRNLCKYGDQFLLVDQHPDYGVLAAFPLPINEIEREEGYDEENPLAFRYRWITQGNRVLDNWQVIHFRLASNDNFLPYGSCIYGSDKVNTISGNPVCIKDIEIGEKIYSFDPDSQQLVPTTVLAKKSNGVKKIYKIKTRHRTIRATGNHPFLLSSGKYKNVEDLRIGDELVAPDLSEKVTSVSEKIELIEYFGEHEVWDIQVDNDLHNFVVQGLVVHNSVLEVGRRVWRQLILMEDAVMVYRIVRCLHGDTNIWTEDGFKKLKDIKVGDSVYSYDQETQGLVPASVTNWINNGSQQIWKIKSKHRTLRANYNHPILVRDKKYDKICYVQVHELEKERFQLVAPKKESGGVAKSVELNDKNYEWFGYLSDGGREKFKSSTYATSKRKIEESVANDHSYSSGRIHQFLYASDKTKGIPYDVAVSLCERLNLVSDLVRHPKGMYNLDRLSLPDVVDEEFARFFGFMVGDGFMTKNLHKIGFSTGVYEKLNIYYANILKKYCSDAVFRRDDRGSKDILGRYEVHNSYFSNLMKDMGFTSSVYTKVIPDWVFTSSDSIKESFIDGLADADGHRRTMRKIESCEIELCNKQLVDGLKELCHQLGWNVSSEIRTRTRPAGRKINGLKIKETISYTVYFTKERSSLYEDIIEIVKTEEYNDVFDIRVDNDLHNFIAGGCVVHNSPERRVFKIDVGNISPQDVPAFMEKARTQLKRNQVLDSSTGRVDLRYNPLSVDEDYFIPIRGEHSSDISSLPGGQFPIRQDSLIPLLDGRTITIKELAEEHDGGKVNWVYSVKDDSHAFVPGKVIWCGKNYRCKDIRRVWLDDGSYIDMAPEHPVVLRDGTAKKVEDLRSGESLMPFRTKTSLRKEDRLDGYQMISNPETDAWEFVHRIVAQEVFDKESALLESDEKTVVVHHCDVNKLNNDPLNLSYVGFWKHREFHRACALKSLHSKETKAKVRKALGSEKHRAFIKNRANDPDDLLCQWIHGEENKQRLAERNRSEKVRAATSLRNSERWNDTLFREKHSGKNHWNFKKWQKVYAQYTLEDLRDFCLQNNISRFKDLVVHEGRPLPSKAQFRKFLKFHGVPSWSQFASSYLDCLRLNHKVDRIEPLEVVDDVYCMTVVGPNGEHDRHNFAVVSKGAEVDGCMNGIFVKNTGDIEDLKYIQNKLFAALKIPKSYLGYEEDVGAKSTLSQQDVRFARTIQRIQRVFVAELNKLAIIHLWSMGFKDKDLANFTISMANPSTIAEMQKLELIRTKFEISNMVPQTGIFDKQFVYDNVWQLPPEDVESIEEGRLKDQMLDLEVQQLQPPIPMEGAQPPVAPPGAPMPPPGAPMGALPPPLPAPGIAPPPSPLGGEMLMAGRDPNMQTVAPNELTKPWGNKKAPNKSMFPDLKNYVFNTKKTAMDPKRNASELTRMVRSPFGEEKDIEEESFERKLNFLRKIEKELQETSGFTSRSKKKVLKS